MPDFWDPAYNDNQEADQGMPQLPPDWLSDQDTLPVPQRGAPYTPSVPRQPSNVAALGGPPALPQIKPWQRVAAGIMGGLQGAINTKAGYPGGPKRPVDYSGAIQGIYGMPQYGRQLQNWQTRVKLAEYEDSLNEKAREADIRDQEARSRMALQGEMMGYTRDQRKALAAQEQARAQQLVEQQRQTWMDKNEVTLPTTSSFNLNLNPTNEDGPQAQDLPGADTSDAPEVAPTTGSQLPSAASIASLTVPAGPPKGAVPNAFQRAPMPQWLAGQYPQGAQAWAKSPGQMAAEKSIGTSVGNAEPISQADQRLAQDSGMVLPEPDASGMVDRRSMNNWRTNARTMADQKARLAAGPKVPQTADDLIALRTAGAQTGIPEYDKIDPQTAKKALEAKKVYPPAYMVQGAQGQLTPQQEAAAMQPVDPKTGVNEAYLKTFPLLEQTAIKQFANYELPFTAYMIARGKDPMFASKVKLYDPSWDESDYQPRQQMKTQYTPGGTVGRNLGSLNTLSQHADGLIQAMQALNNGDVRSLNWFKNNLGMEFGQDAYSNAQIAKTAVQAELATALKGNATDTEIGHWANSITPNMTPEQQAGARRELAQIMFRRMDTQLRPYVTTFHKLPATAASPATQKFFADSGVDPSKLGTGAVNIQGGALSPQEAQGYLRRVGWAGGPPTPQQKQAAAALASKEGRTF